MGPKSQPENEIRAPSGAESDPSARLEGALLRSPDLSERSSESVGSPESWAAQPALQKEPDRRQKEKLDFDALKIFVVLALMTAAMAIVMKFLF
ncbi:MAG: hypothetical protein U1E10_11775 [Bdellovibrionales bacterium]|nr:hypothetical protein [Bdellovibrionales bacterium]